MAYTLGEVTELRSGNNVVHYAYDGKRRKKSVSLNGTENYAQFTYGSDNSSATETNIKGERFTTVTDKFGNLISLKYNDAAQVTNTYESGRVKTTTDLGLFSE